MFQASHRLVKKQTKFEAKQNGMKWNIQLRLASTLRREAGRI